MIFFCRHKYKGCRIFSSPILVNLPVLSFSTCESHNKKGSSDIHRFCKLDTPTCTINEEKNRKKKKRKKKERKTKR